MISHEGKKKKKVNKSNHTTPLLSFQTGEKAGLTYHRLPNVNREGGKQAGRELPPKKVMKGAQLHAVADAAANSV